MYVVLRNYKGAKADYFSDREALLARYRHAFNELLEHAEGDPGFPTAIENMLGASIVYFPNAD